MARRLASSALTVASSVTIVAASATGCGDGDGTGGTTSGVTTGVTSATSASASSAAVASTTSKASASAQSSTGTTTPCPTSLSDEFDDPCTEPLWLAGPVPDVEVYDIDTTTPGHATVVPHQGVWNDDAKSWLAYKEVKDDFVVMTHITVTSLTKMSEAPVSRFNSAGLMARAPMVVAGKESWIMYDIGRQQSFVGSETKSTLAGDSSLYLFTGVRSGRLSLCRVGATFYLSRNLDGETGWTRERTFVRDDMPTTLQVGMAMNAYEQPDVRATFDYVRFGVPASVDDCTADLPPGG